MSFLTRFGDAARSFLTGKRPRDPRPANDGEFLRPKYTDPRKEVAQDEVHAPPYRGPNELDDYGRETDEMRRAYRDFHRTEPAVKSAVEGKVASVAALDVAVLPDDETSELDKKVAEFVRFAVGMAPGGWPGLVTRVLEPGVIDGYSLTEKVVGPVTESAKWGGLWGLAKAASKDSIRLRLQVDVFRNVTGVVNNVRGLNAFDPSKFILYTHSEMFQNPFGRSDLRAAYRSANLIESAYKIWYILLSNYSGPFLIAKSKKTGALRDLFEKHVKLARAGGYLMCAPEDDVKVENLASATSFEAFERKIEKCRQEILLAIRGSYLPFTEGSNTEAVGNSAINKVASDAVEYLLSVSVADCIRRQLFPDLVRPNFGTKCGIPKLMFGGTNPAETKQVLDVAKLVQDLGGEVSKAWIYEVSKVEPPRDAGDILKPPAPPGMPGMAGPPGGGSPFGVPGSPGAPGSPTPPDGGPGGAASGAPEGGDNLPFSDDSDMIKLIGRKVREQFARGFAA